MKIVGDVWVACGGFFDHEQSLKRSAENGQTRRGWLWKGAQTISHHKYNGRITVRATDISRLGGFVVQVKT